MPKKPRDPNAPKKDRKPRGIPIPVQNLMKNTGKSENECRAMLAMPEAPIRGTHMGITIPADLLAQVVERFPHEKAAVSIVRALEELFAAEPEAP